MGERSRDISLPNRLEHKTVRTAPPSSRASINRKEVTWTHIVHATKEADADSSCVCDDDTATTCMECCRKSNPDSISIKSEINHDYARRGTISNDRTGQEQLQVQTFTIV